MCCNKISVPSVKSISKISLLLLIGAFVVYFILASNGYSAVYRFDFIRRPFNWDLLSQPDNETTENVINTSTTFRQYPLNITAIEQEWPQLLNLVQIGLGRSKADVDKFMVHKVPQYNLNDIRIHSLGGQTLTSAELHSLIQDSNTRVPRAVHYVLPFHKPQLEFHHLVCMLGGFWLVRPKAVIFWYNDLPSGKYWDYLVKNTTAYPGHIIMIHRKTPTQVYSNIVQRREHQADVMRMEALLAFGGIYFDLDAVVLKSFDPLLNYSFTIGREIDYGLCNGIMVSEPNSTFLAMWHTAYQLFNDGQWTAHSVQFPHHMAKKWPHLVHVEEESMDRPNWTGGELQWIYGAKREWDWKKKNYCVHLWYRFHRNHYDFETIKKVDSMLGDMFRFVLYGTDNMTAVANVT